MTTSMAKGSASSFFLPLFFLLFLSVSGKTKGECQYVSTIGGGCPDKSQCLETCRPCYRGVGHVVAYCVGPDGPIPYWECRCAFHNNAPCPPLPPPRCPRLWPPPAASSNHTSLPPN